MALLADSRDAFVLAALATLALFAQQIGSHLLGDAVVSDYRAPASSAASSSWSRCWPGRSRAGCARAKRTVRRQEVDLANMAQLSQYIVQNLRESILVVDHENRIRLINESAALMLGDRNAYPGALLGEASPQLLYLLETWRAAHGHARRRRRTRSSRPTAAT